MSSYPVWWDTSITVYNRYEDPQTNVVQWFKHILHNCFWKDTGDKINIGETVLETNDIICRIPENEKFLEKYQWQRKPNDEMSNYFTLGVDDIIIKGEVVDDIDEYTKGHRSSDIKSKYKELQGCMSIDKVGINIGKGRCCPHYFVRGV